MSVKNEFDQIDVQKAQYFAEQYKKQCLFKIGEFNEQIYFSLKENISKDGFINLIYIGTHSRNFNHKLTDNDLEIICQIYGEHSSKLQHIDFSCNLLTSKSSLVLYSFLRKCSSLISLNLQYNIIGIQGGISVLKALCELKEKNNYCLKYLNLEGCRVETDGILEISFERKLYYQERTLIQKFLEDNKQLEELNLGENDIDETGLIETFSILSNVEKLQHLQNLSIDSPYKLLFSEETAYQLSKVLKNNQKIEKLSIRKAGLSDECLIILIKEILENDNLRVLDLGANQISYKGCVYLTQYLKSPYCNLQSLIINNNQIRDNGIDKLEDGLETNSNLVHLNLNYNGLTDDGLFKIAKIIDKNQHLISLQAFWNDFGIKAKREFYYLLHNTTKNLHFDFCVETDAEEEGEYQIYYYDRVLPENIFVTKKYFLKTF